MNIKIEGKESLLEYLQQKEPTKSFKNTKKNNWGREHDIRRKTFKNFDFSGNLSSLDFTYCNFKNCSFTNIWAIAIGLDRCKFSKCTFRQSRFSHLDWDWYGTFFDDCNFFIVQFDEGSFSNIYFSRCHLDNVSFLGFYFFERVEFDVCQLEYTQFNSVIYNEKLEDIDFEYPDILIEDTTIEYCYFTTVDLRNSSIVNCPIYKSSFVDCQLGKNTLRNTVDIEYKSTALIDLQTIMKSDNLDIETLKNFFNVSDFNIKKTVNTVTSKIEFQTVFISYSFKDKAFANLLHKELSKRDIRCFLWEKDAPVGKRLDDIMSSNVLNHDRLLFIASKDSLKSPACHFELTEARRKQAATWEDTFVPIHIDNFLFQVKKNQIRPTDKIDEYWENIEEIKRINSLDFSSFANTVENPSDFNEGVNKIVEALKINKE